MFELMKMTSAVKGGYFDNSDLNKNSEIIPLDKQKEDLFIDVFSSDYVQILKELKKKKNNNSVTVRTVK